ncbi:MFS transporter [Actinomadura terrae]|uniref:MFS transporter n=1 Tax=Actinomadura terrae TaxID=604353 RepID=UPI001FA730F9|nr:MFS transporter [Actinomadura terrae]
MPRRPGSNERHERRSAVLAHRDLRRFLTGQAASLLGDGMVGVALAFAVLDLTGSAADLGLVLAARSVPLVAVLLAGGVIADRLPRRRVMVAADLGRVAGQAVMAALLIGGHARVWELAVLQALHGTATALFTPASTGLLPSLVPGDLLQHANALRGLAASAGNIAGPALAGVLVAATSPGWAIAADAATFAVSAALLAGLTAPARRRAAPRSVRRDLLDGWTEFRSRTWVWVVVAASFTANALFAVFLVLGPAAVRDEAGGATAWAAIVAAFGTGSLLGGLAVLRHRPRRPLRAGMLAVALFPLPTLGLAAHLPAVAVAAPALLGGAGLTVFNALWQTTLQRHVPDRALSRVSAYDWFGSLAGQPVGQAAAGPLAAGVGLHRALWLAGGVQVAAMLATLAVPAVRDLPAAEEPPSRELL